MTFKTSGLNSSIVHQDSVGNWYFWYEDWATKSLPYNTEEECDVALDEYCREVLGYKDDPLNYSEEGEKK